MFKHLDNIQGTTPGGNQEKQIEFAIEEEEHEDGERDLDRD